MRLVVMLLVVLAVAKVGMQEWMARGALREALITAYRDRASVACQKDATALSARVAAKDWARTRDIAVAIGNPAIPVMIWQLDSAQWAQRYRNAHIVLTMPHGGATLTCNYDTVADAALVVRSS